MEWSISLTVVLTLVIVIFFMILDLLVWKPEKLQNKLRKQGVHGPPPSFLVGNVREMRNMKCDTTTKKLEDDKHNYFSRLFPSLQRWKTLYGDTFMFSLGSKLFLFTSNPYTVKQMIMSSSLDLGKPSYQKDQLGPLLGEGILTSNGESWVHQRKLLAPELYAEKIKSMASIMVESSTKLVESWTDRINKEGEIVELTIDNDIKRVSGDVISKACFGSNYENGEEIFQKLEDLQDTMKNQVFSSGFPLLRYLPTHNNSKARRLEREVKELLLKKVEERKKSPTKSDDLLQIIIEASEKILSDQERDKFVVDNSKNMHLAGYETTAVAATWTLMLLAENQEWQHRLREEVAQITNGEPPTADSIRRMKLMTMVIFEALRLYPPVSILSREALNDIVIGGLKVPKGVHIWASMILLHQDPNLWGADAHLFKPNRFADGGYKTGLNFVPFGIGPRTCLGQNLAMAELKILVGSIVSKFSFSLSPKYKHSPVLRLLTVPQHGVTLLIRKVNSHF